MNTLKRFAVCATVSIGSLAAAGARADTLINIKGYGDDGAGVTVAYGYPLMPGMTISMTHPVLVDMRAGDYLLSDAWGQDGALYDAWNYELTAAGSWTSHFYAAVQQGSSTSYTLLLDALAAEEPTCAFHNCSWSTEAEASAAFLRTPAFNLHLSQDTVVAFSSTDFFLSDNAGGMSLLISAVPEPGPWLSLIAGLPLMVLAASRRRQGKGKGKGNRIDCA